MFTDIAAILHPLPRPSEFTSDDGYDITRQEVLAAHDDTVKNLRTSWEEGDVDPLLAALASARRRKENAEQEIRRLTAYGREFVQPRPYTLGDLAEAAGMSISGLRTAYDHHDVDAVAAVTRAKPRNWRAPDADTDTDRAAVRDMLADLERRSPNPSDKRPSLLARTLQDHGWEPHVPTARTPGTKATKRYIRWTRTWPNGTRVTLYQEPTFVATSDNVADDAPRFSVDYTTTNDIHQTGVQLTAFMHTIEQVDENRHTMAAR